MADDSGPNPGWLLHMHSQHRKTERAVSFKNGIKTVDALHTLKPGLTSLYIKMTGLRGLTDKKENRKENKASQFILLPFYLQDYHQQLAIQVGADCFFTNDYDLDEFPWKIEMITSLETIKEH